MEDNKPINIPRSLEIENFTYSYKDKLINSFYSYICKHRTIYKITIKVSNSEKKKYLGNKSTKFEYLITSKEKIHTCLNYMKEAKITKNKEIKNNLIKSLILANLEKPLVFHVENLKNNNIYLTNNQINWSLQKIREEKYPSNDKYLLNISDI